MTGGAVRWWWSGTWLVAARSLVEQLRSRTTRVVTAVLLALSIAAVVVPQLVGGGPATATLATVGPPSAELRRALDALGRAAELDVRFSDEADAAAVRRAVRQGRADAGVAGGRVYVPPGEVGTLPGLVAVAVVEVDTARRLAEAGLTPGQVRTVLAARPPVQEVVGPADDAERAGVGFLVGIVLYLALTVAGSAIATTVATEKSTRISEVLLAVLRPSQAVVGTVLAIGLVTFGQLAVLLTPLAVAVRFGVDVGLPPATGTDLALAAVWFLLGFALYAFVFAATAALVDKVTEVSSAIMPVTITLLAAYLLGVLVVAGDPDGAAATAASMFPLSAPLAMPIRWSNGGVPVWQLLVAMGLTAAAAVGFVAVGAAVYRRALVVTGRRIRLRELVAWARPT